VVISGQLGDNIDQVSVMDIVSNNEIFTFGLGETCSSVEVCNNGYVLVNTISLSTRLLRINETGYLTDTGQSYDWESCNPTNVICSPDGTFAVGATTACDFDTDLLSFSIPGLVQVSMKILLVVPPVQQMATCSVRSIPLMESGRESALVPRPSVTWMGVVLAKKPCSRVDRSRGNQMVQAHVVRITRAFVPLRRATTYRQASTEGYDCVCECTSQ
jgi:hypothetical protein